MTDNELLNIDANVLVRSKELLTSFIALYKSVIGYTPSCSTCNIRKKIKEVKNALNKGKDKIKPRVMNGIVHKNTGVLKNTKYQTRIPYTNLFLNKDAHDAVFLMFLKGSDFQTRKPLFHTLPNGIDENGVVSDYGNKVIENYLNGIYETEQPKEVAEVKEEVAEVAPTPKKRRRRKKN